MEYNYVETMDTGRDWWLWFHHEGFPLWVVNHLPKRILLWAFIKVYAGSVDSPKEDYKRAYDKWVEIHGNL